MIGTRKFKIAVIYLIGCFIIAGVVAYTQESLVGIGVMATGIATGVGVFMWGNAQEHKNDPPKTP